MRHFLRLVAFRDKNNVGIVNFIQKNTMVKKI